MSYPKFSVGEDVLIYSTSHPEIQGVECLVLAVNFYRGYIIGTNTQYEGWTYQVDPCPLGGRGWVETSLRKRPADMSFNELMNSFKITEPA